MGDAKRLVVLARESRGLFEQRDRGVGVSRVALDLGGAREGADEGRAVLQVAREGDGVLECFAGLGGAARVAAPRRRAAGPIRGSPAPRLRRVKAPVATRTARKRAHGRGQGAFGPDHVSSGLSSPPSTGLARKSRKPKLAPESRWSVATCAQWRVS